MQVGLLTTLSEAYKDTLRKAIVPAGGLLGRRVGRKPDAPSFSRFRAIAQIVGRTPSSAADPLVGFSVAAD